jgi:hypothetical protein
MGGDTNNHDAGPSHPFQECDPRCVRVPLKRIGAAVLRREPANPAAVVCPMLRIPPVSRMRENLECSLGATLSEWSPNGTAGKLAFYSSALSSTPTRLTSKWGNTRAWCLAGPVKAKESSQGSQENARRDEQIPS